MSSVISKETLSRIRKRLSIAEKQRFDSLKNTSPEAWLFQAVKSECYSHEQSREIERLRNEINKLRRDAEHTQMWIDLIKAALKR